MGLLAGFWKVFDLLSHGFPTFCVVFFMILWGLMGLMTMFLGVSHRLMTVRCRAIGPRPRVEDSLATLRFCESVKQVRTKPVLPMSQREAVVIELQAPLSGGNGGICRGFSWFFHGFSMVFDGF